MRLTGAQVTRVREEVERYNEKVLMEWGVSEGSEGRHLPVEDLVEEILKIVGSLDPFGHGLPKSSPYSSYSDPIVGGGEPAGENDEPVY